MRLNNRFVFRMVKNSRQLLIAKYFFLALLILCLTVVSSILYLSDSSISQNENSGEVEHVKILSPEFSTDMLDPDFEACFFSNFTRSSSQVQVNKTHPSVEKFKTQDVINLLIQFAETSHQIGIEIFLIEPSLLFCILSPTLKMLLIKRNFTQESKTTERVLTMGIFQRDAAILGKEDVQKRLAELGFHVEVVDSPTKKWMKSEAYLNSSMFTSHIFLQKNEWILHLVVFHERQSFLWHSALLSQADSKTVTKETFLLVKHDAAFENFTVVSLGFINSRLRNVNIPANPASFLHQIASSKFLECNDTIVDVFKRQTVSDLSTHHEYSSLTLQEFNQRLLITIQELKLELYPMLISFWVWSGTLLGLHRQCDVIPYTSDADFATWETDGADVDELIKIFKQNEHLTIKQKLGMADNGLELKFNCHGLRVDLFFVYGQRNGTWYAGHSPKNGYYFKYHHPTFSLCSAELLGQKVNVPCEPEKVITAEYGPKWMYPVSSWSYEHSVHNRGPNIFWEKKLLKNLYKYF